MIRYGSASNQVMDKLCAAVAFSQASPTTRAYLITALTKLAARQLVLQGGGGGAAAAALRPEAQDLLHKAGCSSLVELQQRAQQAAALLK